MAKKKSAVIATALVLRTCAADMTSHGGFTWPVSGTCEAPDWSDQPVCGSGLHGLLWGLGDGSLLSWDEHAKWLVVEVPIDSIVELNGKVKFPRCEIVFCGNRDGATQMIAAVHPGPIVGLSTLSSANSSTVAVGYRGTATAGEGGTIEIAHFDGSRSRRLVAYVGEGGIVAGTRYRLVGGAFAAVVK